jgi:hypothetical protein
MRIFFIAALISTIVAPAFAGDEPVIKINFARYIATNGKFCEFAKKFTCTGSACRALDINNSLCGDPQNGADKTAFVSYQCAWDAPQTLFIRPLQRIAIVREGGSLNPSCVGADPVPVHKPVIAVTQASYRDPSSCSGANCSRQCEPKSVQTLVSGMCNGSASCQIPVSNALCPGGDPSNGATKELLVSYACVYAWKSTVLGTVTNVTKREGETISFECN